MIVVSTYCVFQLYDLFSGPPVIEALQIFNLETWNFGRNIHQNLKFSEKFQDLILFHQHLCLICSTFQSALHEQFAHTGRVRYNAVVKVGHFMSVLCITTTVLALWGWGNDSKMDHEHTVYPMKYAHKFVVWGWSIISISYTLSREYRVARNRYSRLLFTSEDRFCANSHVQEQSTNMI